MGSKRPVGRPLCGQCLIRFSDQLTFMGCLLVSSGVISAGYALPHLVLTKLFETILSMFILRN